MPRPNILQDIDETVIAVDEELYDNELPIDANTLAGHPVDYFASKTYVNQAILNYVSTILGNSY